MPRRNANTRTERYSPVHGPGTYPLSELADMSPLEELAARFAENRRRIRSVSR